MNDDDADPTPATSFEQRRIAWASSDVRSWTRRLLAVGAGAVAFAAVRRALQLSAVEPSLRTPALLPPLTFSSVTTPIFRRLQDLAPPPVVPPGIRLTERRVAAQQDQPAVRLVIVERAASSNPRPAILWLHGGGFVLGKPEQDMVLLTRMLERLDVVIVCVDYRLAPEHPFPAALDDACAAFEWIAARAVELSIDSTRIAIGGASAGGGLAAATVQRVVDSSTTKPAFQSLMYPMLDVLTTRGRKPHGVGDFVWTPRSNRFGWRSYLGSLPNGRQSPSYAVPASRRDLSRLPPAWIGVGTLDLFHDEDIEYGRHLRAAGVDCEVLVVDRAYHAFDSFAPDAVVTLEFYHAMFSALEHGLGLTKAQALA